MDDLRLGYVEGFKVLNALDKRVLTSPARSSEWHSRFLDATCSHVSRDGHVLAGEGCSCGIYASSTLANAAPYWNGKVVPVMAKVRGYGTVTEGDQAWRASNVEIVSLYQAPQPFRVLKRSLLVFLSTMFLSVLGFFALGRFLMFHRSQSETVMFLTQSVGLVSGCLMIVSLAILILFSVFALDIWRRKPLNEFDGIHVTHDPVEFLGPDASVDDLNTLKELVDR